MNVTIIHTHSHSSTDKYSFCTSSTCIIPSEISDSGFSLQATFGGQGQYSFFSCGSSRQNPGITMATVTGVVSAPSGEGTLDWCPVKHFSFLLHEKHASMMCLVAMSSFNPQRTLIR